MQKSKLAFFFITSALAISALIGCGNKPINSSIEQSSIDNGPSQTCSGMTTPPSSSLEPSSVEASSSQKPSSIISSSEQTSSSEAPSSSSAQPSSSQAPSSSEQPSSSEEPPVTLSYIDVELPDKTQYTTDDTELDLTGLVVIAHYSDEHTEIITEGYTVSTPDFSTPGQVPVYVRYQGAEVYFLINIVQAAPKDWDDDTKAEMKSRLHGLVLPYASIPANVTYSGDAIIVRSTETMEEDFLANYAALHEEQGWYGGDNSEEAGADPNSGVSYCYHKAVIVEGQKYVVESYFFGMDMNTYEYSKTGTFFISALDPFVYSYPEAELQEYLNERFMSNIYPPVVEADYYDSGYLARLACYTDTNIENAYKATIDASDDYYLFEDKDDEGFYRALSADGKYILCFKYDADLKAFILTYDYAANDPWPAAAISDAFSELNFNDELPVFTISTQEYKVIDNDPNYDLVISCLLGKRMISGAYIGYAEHLVEAGFIQDSERVFLSPSLEYKVILTDYEHFFEINIKENIGIWPSAELAAIYETLGFNQDYVPEPTYGNGLLRPRDYKLSQNDDGSYLITATFSKSEDSEDVYRTKEAYLSYLRNLGFTETFYDGSGRYWRLSPNAEFCIQSDCWNNYMYITFKPYVPSNGYDECMESVANILGTGLTPPSLEISDATNYRTSTYYYQGYSNIGIHVYVSFPSETNLSDKLAELENNLVEQGYTFNKYHDYGGYLKLLEGYNHVVFVKPYISGDRLCIDVHREDVSLTGYGIYILEYNSDTGELWSYDYKVAHYDDDLGAYTFDEPIELTADKYISAYDFTNEVAFNISIDDTSLGGNVDEYLAYDSEKQEYRVLQDFESLVYIHVSESGSMMYFKTNEGPVSDNYDDAYEVASEWLDIYENEVTYTLPDVHIADAKRYDGYASGFITITFANGTNLEEKANALIASLEAQHFHYSYLRDGYVIDLEDGDVWLEAHVSIEEDRNYVKINFEVEDYSIDNYGLGYYYRNNSGGRNGEWSIEAQYLNTENGYDQYVLYGFEFYKDMVFFAYDYNFENLINAAPDSYSLGQNYEEYLEYDATNGTYYVKKNFTADVYIKLKYGADCIYFGFSS